MWENHEFLSIAWASPAYRETWEPRCEAIIRALHTLEAASISFGLRRSALRWVPVGALPEFFDEISRFELACAVVGQQEVGTGYQSRAFALNENATHIAFAISKNRSDGARLKLAYTTRDDIAVGDLLGYPKCCTEAFVTRWSSGSIDPTWAACEAIASTAGSVRLEAHSFHHLSNLALRWLGIRSCFHLPCSFHCPATIETATRLGELALQLGFETEWNWIEEALSWPFTWSARNGIGEMVTPTCRFAFSSDQRVGLSTIQYSGGVRGLQDQKHCASDARAQPMVFRETSNSPDIWSPSRNGFANAARMRLAHEWLARKIFPFVDPTCALTVVDLGCGDGTFLQLLGSRLPNANLVGIEIAPPHHEVSLNRGLTQRIKFIRKDIFDDSYEWTSHGNVIAIIAIQRLLEISRSQILEFSAAVRQSRSLVFLYSYDQSLSVEQGVCSAGLALNVFQVEKHFAVAT